MTPPSNLVAAWIAQAETIPGRTVAAEWRDLLEATGYRAGRGRLYEWRDGKKTPPAKVLRYMAREAALSILGPYGITDYADLDAIADAFSPPTRAQ